MVPGISMACQVPGLPDIVFIRDRTGYPMSYRRAIDEIGAT
jgi:hypothetical protein